MIAAGEVSSREVLSDLRARVDAVEPFINAVTWRMDEAAEAAATTADEAVAAGVELGPLHGVPVSIKDQFEVLGTPSTRGLPSRAGHRSTPRGAAGRSPARGRGDPLRQDQRPGHADGDRDPQPAVRADQQPLRPRAHAGRVQRGRGRPAGGPGHALRARRRHRRQPARARPLLRDRHDQAHVAPPAVGRQPAGVRRVAGGHRPAVRSDGPNGRGRRPGVPGAGRAHRRAAGRAEGAARPRGGPGRGRRGRADRRDLRGRRWADPVAGGPPRRPRGGQRPRGRRGPGRAVGPRPGRGGVRAVRHAAGRRRVQAPARGHRGRPALAGHPAAHRVRAPPTAGRAWPRPCAAGARPGRGRPRPCATSAAAPSTPTPTRSSPARTCSVGWRGPSTRAPTSWSCRPTRCPPCATASSAT